MSSLNDRIAPRDPSNAALRVTLFTALSLLCRGAEILSQLPAAETALPAGDRERFRLLSAAEVALRWLVGHRAKDSVESLGPESALGDAATALDWPADTLESHFAAALDDWREDN